LNHDKLRQRRARSGTGAGWRPKVGQNHIRILPPRSRYLDDWDAMDDVAIVYRLHFFKVDGRPADTARCLEDVGKRCPACAAWRAHRKSEDPGLAELARAIAPSSRYLINIIDLSNVQAGVQAWEANWTCWDKV